MNQKAVFRNSLRFSLRRTIPIMIGFFPVGLAYGILMQNAGYNALWSGLCSLFVFAGSLQMLMVTFFTDTLPLITIIIMAALLNSRHIFYGLSFIEKFRGYGPWRWFLIYGLTDENYSLLCAYKPTENVDEKTVHILSSALTLLYWIAFASFGGIVGQLITFDTTGIDFALTGLFVVILIEQLKGNQNRWPAAISISSGIVCILIFGAGNFLLPSLVITVAVLLLLRGQFDKRGLASV